MSIPYASEEQVAEAVERGIDSLDELLGESWVHSVHLFKFQLDSCERCVLGQAFHEEATATWGTGWTVGKQRLGIPDKYGETTRLGFDSGTFEGRFYAYDVLQEAWKDRIAELQAERAVEVEA